MTRNFKRNYASLLWEFRAKLSSNRGLAPLPLDHRVEKSLRSVGHGAQCTRVRSSGYSTIYYTGCRLSHAVYPAACGCAPSNPSNALSFVYRASVPNARGRPGLFRCSGRRQQRRPTAQAVEQKTMIGLIIIANLRPRCCCCC